MTHLCAAIPVETTQARNATLEAAGFGPRNFGVPLWAAVRPSFAAMLAARDVAFWGAVKALPAVQWQEVQDLAEATAFVRGLSAEWALDAPPLPDEGVVSPGEVYSRADPELQDVVLWRVIQTHDRGVFGGDPTTYPALIRRARRPGAVEPWVQPLDQFDAYLTLEPITGEGERVWFGGQRWRCVQGSAGGPNGSLLNTWQPGVFGWETEGS